MERVGLRLENALCPAADNDAVSGQISMLDDLPGQAGHGVFIEALFLFQHHTRGHGRAAHSLAVHTAEPSVDMLIEPAYYAGIHLGLTGNFVDQSSVKKLPSK